MYNPPPARLLRAARIALGLSQRKLAELSGLNERTIYRVESGKAEMESVVAVHRTLVHAGIEFIDETETRGPGIFVAKEVSGQE